MLLIVSYLPTCLLYYKQQNNEVLKNSMTDESYVPQFYMSPLLDWVYYFFIEQKL